MVFVPKVDLMTLSSVTDFRASWSEVCHGSVVVESKASDLIFNPIYFLHDSWGAPLPSISSPNVGGGKFFGAESAQNRRRIGAESAQNRRRIGTRLSHYR